jgi:hypothetical protein
VVLMIVILGADKGIQDENQSRRSAECIWIEGFATSYHYLHVLKMVRMMTVPRTN